MKRKSVARNKSEYAALLAKLDGSYKGISRDEARQLLKMMEALEVALIIKGYKSAALLVRKSAKKKAGKIKNGKMV